MKVIPAIDIIGGKTVRLEQGDYGRKLGYEIDPVEAARKWEAVGAEMLHVVDLDGARDGYPVNLDLVREIVRSVNIPVEIGGGYRKELDIKDALDHGIRRVVVGSKALEDADFARDCIETFGDRVIISVDAAGCSLKVHGWKRSVALDLIDTVKRFRRLGASEIIYTDIRKDGTLSGPSLDDIEHILDSTGIKLISAGGVKTVEHVALLKKLEPKGLSGVIIGRALYDGTIDLGEAIDAGKEDNTLS